MKNFLFIFIIMLFMTNTPLVLPKAFLKKQERIEQQAQEEKNKIQEATDKLNEVSEKMTYLASRT